MVVGGKPIETQLVKRETIQFELGNIKRQKILRDLDGTGPAMQQQEEVKSNDVTASLSLSTQKALGNIEKEQKANEIPENLR